MSLGIHNPYPEIRKRAWLSDTKETCGLLLDTGRGGLEYLECENVHNEPSQNFGIAGSVLLRYRDRILAVVHHHPPGCQTTFTEKDLRCSESLGYPFVLYVTETDSFLRYRPRKVRHHYEGRRFIFSLQDCVTLLSDWLLEVKRLSFPLFCVDPREMVVGIKNWQESVESIGLVRHSEPVPESIVGFRTGSNGAVTHCGVVTSDLRLLHQWAGSESERVMLTTDWQQRAAGYWA